ncbi:glycosyltransferase [Mixta intestinalis]|uniref:UDP-Gal:alpha-D-GlcNAc-diphosphoundecaprenol beta-1,3-galactosyltransferase n=1 Tax=Mixta intestinalis TaxID=1615494 RepID=A0A6P1PZH9_9GAMM|nr:glycosyltransferase [Mixta intestinalis]QHM71581.1 UDP-Gal:alpha-D-GlcNAc-diphosphoundecaprenol beta-1,3-galactosyltransferase [Mixta intestinalis]
MNKNIQYSVLMSLYYKENPGYLDKCLLSLAEQTILPAQVVIVYDGNISNELNMVVHKWMDQLNIDIIQLNKNVGLGKALNEGLRHCNYDLIGRMDTDDICLPKRFEIQLEAFEKDPMLSIHGGYIAEFNSIIEQQTGLRKVPLDNEDIIRFCRLKNPFNHMTVMFRKKVIEEIGGYRHHLFMEDYNLWIRLLSSGFKGRNVDQVLVYARAGDAMLKRRKGLQYVKSEWQLARLKKDVGLTDNITMVKIFLLRSLPRLLPTSILKLLYTKIRN